jgi:hypothetical protein
VPARTITSIAAEFGDSSIELLKLDIEGAEYAVLGGIDLAALGVRVLCVEYHSDHGLGRVLRAAQSVIDQGYAVAALDKTDVTFVALETRR